VGIVAENHGSVRDCYALVGGKMGHFAGEALIRAQIALVRMPEEGPAKGSSPRRRFHSAARAAACASRRAFGRN
jgi:hypothetical protein